MPELGKGQLLMRIHDGVVRWFSSDRGFGFITSAEFGDGDIFVHFNDIEDDGFRTLYEGDLVSCDVVENPESTKNQFMAKNVVVTEREEPTVSISTNPRHAASELGKIFTPKEREVFKLFFGKG